MVTDNKSLGKFILDGLPTAPRGVPQIEVAFDVDANGILNVTATDKATGRDQSMKIMPDGGLSDADIERMVEEAEKYKEEDIQRKAEIETRNQADTMVHSAEKTLSEHGETLDEAVKLDIEEKIKDVKTALEGQEIEPIQTAADALSQAMQKAGEQMYQQPDASADPAGSANAGTDPKAKSADDDEDVVEGQFEEA